MTRPAYWLFHLSNAWVIGTGLVYGWMRYLCTPVNEFAVANHPWQPHLQHLHVISAPFLTVMLGYFWALHFLPHWKSKIKQGRKSGLGLAVLAAPMVLSGYFLQTAPSPTWRTVWMWTHGLSGTVWALFSVIHIIRHWIQRQKAPEILQAPNN